MKSYFLFVAFGLAIQLSTYKRTAARPHHQQPIQRTLQLNQLQNGHHIHPPQIMMLSTPSHFRLAHPARGCDTSGHAKLCIPPVSTRAPREGVRRGGAGDGEAGEWFQLAHPARGCDVRCQGTEAWGIVSTRAPREGVRLVMSSPFIVYSKVSTRAPREGVRRFQHAADGS